MSLSTIGLSMPITTFKIELLESQRGICRGNPIYETGDEIQGAITLSSYAEFSCLAIEVCLEGTATVHYLTPDKVPLTKKERLPLQWTRINLVGNRGKRELFNMPKDCYSYQFSILLKKLSPFPGTFESTNGKLEYQIAAVVKTITEGSDCRVKRPIIIRSYLNLWSLVNAKKPLTVSYPQSPSAFVNTPEEGELKFFFSLNRTGFCPGEIIQFKLRLSNPQAKRVEKLFVSLYKRSTFTTSDENIKTCEMVLDSKLTMNPAMINFEVTGWSSTLTVPLEAYPSTTGIIIQHYYFIRVEVTASGIVDPAYIRALMVKDAPIVRDQPNSLLRKDIPIIIGTVNEKEGQQNGSENDCLRERSLSIESISSIGPLASLPRYSQLSSRAASLASLRTLPPSYEDTVSTVVGTPFNNQFY